MNSPDPTAAHIDRTMTHIRLVALVLASYCESNEREHGEPVPLDLPVELRGRIQLAIDAVADAYDEADKCRAIGAN